ncbi:MAG: acyl-ACP--UDP-N-acetylglucosamine O-acyltransferase [Thermanaerothrix sp.]|nr:acyl-ACP--UDP-N-acetylglucosamine O-acyltransferase [Thermanaerothrix sp.]
MSVLVHPTAVVSPEAQIGEGVVIGPYCVIDGKVVIGDGTVLESFVRICDYVKIGPRCRIYDHVTLGRAPQDFGFKGEESWVRIGADVVMRENVTVHRASGEGKETVVGDGTYLMEGCHLGHNVRVGSHCVLANKVGLAGYSTVGDRVTIGGMAGVHQFVSIGRSCMIGGLSKVVKDVPPFCLADGRPARIHGLNKVGLRRQGFSAEDRSRIRWIYDELRTGPLPLREALKDLAERLPEDRFVRELLDFMGCCRRGWTPWAHRCDSPEE